MPTYIFETDDGATHEMLMSIAEMEERVVDGCITLDDGRKATRVYGRPGRRGTRNVDKTSVALQVLNQDTNEVLAQDRRIDPNSAPNYYDAEGKPHWTGDAIAVRQRKRRYCDQRGLAWDE